MESGSTTRRRALARRFCSSTSSRGIIGAGSRRSASSPSRYRCIVYDARGYPPSDVPTDVASYTQDLAVTDALAVLDHLEIERAHVVGLSMGAFATLHLGLRHPSRTASLVVAGCGYGAHPDARDAFRAESEAVARAFEEETAAGIAPNTRRDRLGSSS